MTELIAPDLAGVEDLAVALATDLNRLARLRRELPRAFRASSVADIPRLARELEDLYARAIVDGVVAPDASA